MVFQMVPVYSIPLKTSYIRYIRISKTLSNSIKCINSNKFTEELKNHCSTYIVNYFVENLKLVSCPQCSLLINFPEEQRIYTHI